MTSTGAGTPGEQLEGDDALADQHLEAVHRSRAALAARPR